LDKALTSAGLWMVLSRGKLDVMLLVFPSSYNALRRDLH
jgi:hypothetical protein